MKSICSVAGCERTAKARGWCMRHYHRWRKHGSVDVVLPHGRIGWSLEQRFRARVDDSAGPDACWAWKGEHDDCGYGVAYADGKPAKAHRVSWQLANGPIPPGLYICHSCDNPGCVNPKHLWPGTQRENVHDMHRKGRDRKSRGNEHYARVHPELTARGSRCGNVKLTEDQVRELRRDFAQGTSARELALRYGIHYKSASRIGRDRGWAHVTA